MAPGKDVDIKKVHLQHSGHDQQEITNISRDKAKVEIVVLSEINIPRKRKHQELP